MAAEFEVVFARLRSILHQHARALTVKEDTASCYSLDAPIGPATLRAWGGKARSERMPVAWAEIGKAYVSFHMMPLYGDSKLQQSLSPALKARMQGKTCFNFKKTDDALFDELAQLTARGISGFRKAGFIT